ncbi:hypothetical protein M514_02170 [Trichuris suis]|uniref:Uncharacterized protein n=1 Tax=Trichuris suis TaxID=68888 RepID=A0A085MI67_9BILA|nr:hypothetical protein M513_02170 [Trichuris suis]KFD66153.1 hypothetical protein M514_02170 [Trichuris suis]
MDNPPLVQSSVHYVSPAMFRRFSFGGALILMLARFLRASLPCSRCAPDMLTIYTMTGFGCSDARTETDENAVSRMTLRRRRLLASRYEKENKIMIDLLQAYATRCELSGFDYCMKEQEMRFLRNGHNAAVKALQDRDLASQAISINRSTDPLLVLLKGSIH